MFLDLLIFDNIWTSTDLDMNLDAILNFGLLIAWNLEQNGICRESKMRTQKKKKKWNQEEIAVENFSWKVLLGNSFQHDVFWLILKNIYDHLWMTASVIRISCIVGKLWWKMYITGRFSATFSDLFGTHFLS